MKKFVFVLILIFANTAMSFQIDFSRRIKQQSNPGEVRLTPTEVSPENKQFLPTPPPVLSAESAVTKVTPANDIVILSTESGFVPKSVTVRRGIPYRFHVVNVNEKEKNTSFILNSFNQYQGTYYGQIKTFDLIPNQEGIFTFQSPETAYEGRLVVIPQTEEQRSPASEE